MSASERPCGAVPDDDASPAGRVPLPAWELKRFCPPTPASAAVVLPRAARCSRRAPPSQPGAATWGCSQAVAARVPRRGTCAHTARRVARAAAAAAFAAPAAAARCPLRWQWAAESFLRRHASHIPRVYPCPAGARVPASHTNANQRIEARMRSEATAAFLHRFVPSLPQKRPTQNDAFSFPGAHGGFNGSAISHVTFCFANSSGFEASLNAAKWPRVQPQPASPALQGFFCFLSLAPYAGVLNTT